MLFGAPLGSHRCDVERVDQSRLLHDAARAYPVVTLPRTDSGPAVEPAATSKPSEVALPPAHRSAPSNAGLVRR